jgi:hypothetical protein
MVGSLKKNTTLEYSTRVVQEGDRRCEKSTLNDLAYLTPLRIPLMNPVRGSREVIVYYHIWFGYKYSKTTYPDEIYPSPQLPPSFVLNERKKKF